MVFMKNITINIPDIYNTKLLELIELKLIPNRSEGIRIALREFFYKEFNFLEVLGMEKPDIQLENDKYEHLKLSVINENSNS